MMILYADLLTFMYGYKMYVIVYVCILFIIIFDVASVMLQQQVCFNNYYYEPVYAN